MPEWTEGATAAGELTGVAELTRFAHGARSWIGVHASKCPNVALNAMPNAAQATITTATLNSNRFEARGADAARAESADANT